MKRRPRRDLKLRRTVLAIFSVCLTSQPTEERKIGIRNRETKKGMK
jgi:hypothetical protein